MRPQYSSSSERTPRHKNRVVWGPILNREPLVTGRGFSISALRSRTFAHLLTFGHGPAVGGTGADSGGAGCGDGVVGAGAGFGARFLDFALLAGFAIFIPFFFRAGAPRFAFLDFFATFNIPIKLMTRLTPLVSNLATRTA